MPSLNQSRHLLVVPHGKLGAVAFAALHDGSRYLGEQVAIAVAPASLWPRNWLRPAPRVEALPLVGVTHNAPRSCKPGSRCAPATVPRCGSKPTMAPAARRFPIWAGRRTASISLATVSFAPTTRLSALELADGNFFGTGRRETVLGNALVVLQCL